MGIAQGGSDIVIGMAYIVPWLDNELHIKLICYRRRLINGMCLLFRSSWCQAYETKASQLMYW